MPSYTRLASRDKEKRVKKQTRLCDKSALPSKILRAKILRWPRLLIVIYMHEIKKGQLLELQDLGVGHVLKVLQWVVPKLDQAPIDGNPVPHHARYTVELWIQSKVHRVEIHVYFEWPGEVLHRSWNQIGAYEGRRPVKIIG